MAVRYFFRRAVREDDKLFRELAFASWEQLAERQEQGFGKLREVLATQSDRLELALGELRVYLVQTHAAVLDIKEEQSRQGDLNLAIYEAVLSLGQRLEILQREVRPQDSLSLRSENERQLARQLLSRFKALPPKQQRQSPALPTGWGNCNWLQGISALRRKSSRKSPSAFMTPRVRRRRITMLTRPPSNKGIWSRHCRFSRAQQSWIQADSHLFHSASSNQSASWGRAGLG
jgi:hypothetical protein